MYQNSRLRFTKHLFAFSFLMILGINTGFSSQSAAVKLLGSVQSSAAQNSVFADMDESGIIRHLSGVFIENSGETFFSLSENFLVENKDAFGFSNFHQELVVYKNETDHLRFNHLSFQQHYDGIPVYNHFIKLHGDKSGNLTSLSNDFHTGISINSNPVFSRQQAVDSVISSLDHPALDSRSIQLVIFIHSDGPHLVYVFDVYMGLDSRRYLVDAHTNETLKTYPLAYHDGPSVGSGINLLDEQVDFLNIYEGDSFDWNPVWEIFSPPPGTGNYNSVDVSDPDAGIIYLVTAHNTNYEVIDFVQSDTVEFYSTDNFDSHKSGVSAMDYHRNTLDYYRDVHSRNGIDDNGYRLVVIVDLGPNWQNAMYAGYALVYGSGGGSNRPWCAGLDVVAHEFTHGVTGYTSGLVYENHSGALNESLSDIFGYLVEAEYQDDPDWLVAEDITISGNGIRSMDNPTGYGDPDNINHPYYTPPTGNPSGGNDYGGVHSNSGIPNKVFQLMVDGGTHYDVEVAALDEDLETSRGIAADIFYIWNTQYLTPYDDFTSSAIKMLQVCTDIFPLYPQFYETAYDAWLSVGIDVFAVDLTLGEILMLITEGDDDLVINPGEAFDFLPSLTNSGTYDAVDVMVSINCEAQGITILQDELDYGDIDTGETAYPPDSGFQFTVSDDTALGHAGCMLNAVAINEQGDLNSFSFPLDISVTLYQDGWPVLTESPVQSSPACVDLENDGSAKEIVFGDNSGYLHAVNTQGNELLGWPFDTGDDVWSSPAVADINNDGSIEIIVGSKSGHLFILDENANVLLNLNVGKYIMAAPALGNLDDDADMEIVFGTYSSPASTNMLYAIDPDGSHLPGFPISLGEKIQRGAALADFNGNGYDDIVVGTDSENIYLILDDGSIAEGFPFDQSTGDFRIAPSILELNESEKLILAANRHEQLFAIDSAGNLVFSYETIADINTSCAFINDPAGTVILFGSDDGFLYAIDPDGNDLPGWPVDLGSSVTSDPVIADLDANGDSEIVTGTNSGEFFALNLDGSYHPQFPISHTFGITGPALIIDTDEDGDLEIIAGASNGLVSIDLKSPGLSDDLWSIYRGGYLRRGYFAGSPTNLIIGDLNQDFILDILDIVRLVNIIMGDEPTEHEFNSGDANSDGILNVQDIIIILNIILGS